MPRDLAAAMGWWLRAAGQRYAYGMLMTALCYEEGEGVERNREQALHRYRKVAARTDGNADIPEVLRRGDRDTRFLLKMAREIMAKREGKPLDEEEPEPVSVVVPDSAEAPDAEED